MPSSGGATSTRRSAASARGATRSPRMAPAPTPGRLTATAVRDAATGDYVLNGEKWFVTGPDDTDFMIFHCLVVDGDERRPTLFLVDYDTPGVVVHARPRLHAHVRRPAPAVRADRRPRAGVGRAGRRRAGGRADQRVVRRGADPHRRALCRGDGAAADARARVGHGAGPVRAADLRLPGRQLPAGRFGRRRVCGAAAHPRVRLAGRHRRRCQGRPRQGVAGQAVRVGGGLALRRPRGPGVRGARLHARVRPGTVPARAAGRPDLGGDLGDPAR